ncbi:hypothetical protein R3I93_010881 [Phoxinus phoxinus]|uniref:Uncharacterized protein n=1 Tax=Phoxinus phoxinus TaxID=58324 RepID=A0AAN9D2R4_9TELE
MMDAVICSTSLFYSTLCSSCTAETKLLNPSFTIHNNVSFTVSTVNPVRHKLQLGTVQTCNYSFLRMGCTQITYNSTSIGKPRANVKPVSAQNKKSIHLDQKAEAGAAKCNHSGNRSEASSGYEKTPSIAVR